MSDSESTSQETMEENSGPSGPLYKLSVKQFVVYCNLKRSTASNI